MRESMKYGHSVKASEHTYVVLWITPGKTFCTSVKVLPFFDSLPTANHSNTSRWCQINVQVVEEPKDKVHA